VCGIHAIGAASRLLASDVRLARAASDTGIDVGNPAYERGGRRKPSLERTGWASGDRVSSTALLGSLVLSVVLQGELVEVD
jgi:hypothetical protein